jgi:hypothetical protein
LDHLNDLNTNLRGDYLESASSALAKLKAVRTPSFHQQAVELVKKRERQIDVMAVEGAQIEGLRRENAMLKERLKEFDQNQEELKRA